MEDNLESGWVSVRPKIFDEKERHKFVFIVAWNDVEGKFAITCHNRTVQKRSTFLDPLLDCSPAVELPAPGASVAEKQAAHPVTTGNDGVCPAGKVRSNTVSKGKTASKADSSKTSECVSPTLGSWDVVIPKVTDMEVLDPGDALEVPLSPDEAGDSDSSHQDFSWAGLFSVPDLRAAHLQLCAVNSDLEPCLPSFPEEQSGMWTVLFGAPGVSRRETDALCYQLQVYLGHALDTCGWRIFSQVLFCDSDDTEEYYESLGELRQKGYEDALQRAKRRMQEVKSFL